MSEADPATIADDQDLDTREDAGKPQEGQPADHARSPDTPEPGDADDGDSILDRDPLLLATQPAAEIPSESTTEQPAKPESEPPVDTKPAAKAEPEPKETKPAEPADEVPAEALEDLPDEDYGKLSHKGKSTFHLQRRTIRKQQEDLKAAKESAEKAKQDYHTVEKFREDLGLDREEYLNGLMLIGAAKRSDPRALEILEEITEDIRKVNGITKQVQQAQTAPAVDLAKLEGLIERYQTDLDDTELKAFLAEAKKGKQEEPAPAAKEERPKREPVQRNADAPSVDEIQENQSTIKALIGLGIPREKVVEYARELVTDVVKQAGQVPAVGERMEAVIAAHQKRVTRQPPRPRQAPPVSGMGQGARRVPTAGNPEQPQDPLKIALRR